MYHQQCSTNFRTGKAIPKKFYMYSKQSGKKLMSRVIQWKKIELKRSCLSPKCLEENDDEKITVIDLSNKMEDYLKLGGSTQDPYYRVQYMEQKI